LSSPLLKATETDYVKGADIDTGEEIAIKLEHIGDNMPTLEYEADIYKDLSGGPKKIREDIKSALTPF
jgi:hypothetical protein